MIAITQENREVFYTPESLIAVGAAEVTFLKERAGENPRLRSRLCTHASPQEALHEMIIVHHRDCYVRPHRHRLSPESLHVIEGSAQVIVFDDPGGVSRTFTASVPAQHGIFYYRMPPLQYHSLVITSEWFVFHETTTGPFIRSNTEFPEWAPDGSDDVLAREFVTRVLKQVGRLTSP
jgi:cupin fold WbuC family metalloprotein